MGFGLEELLHLKEPLGAIERLIEIARRPHEGVHRDAAFDGLFFEERVALFAGGQHRVELLEVLEVNLVE